MKSQEAIYSVLAGVRLVLNSVLSLLSEPVSSQRLTDMAEVLEGQAKVLRDVAEAG